MCAGSTDPCLPAGRSPRRFGGFAIIYYMKLLYIGAGFVGTCSAAVSASSGHEVLVYDIDEKKIKMLSSGDRDQIEACLFEEGLSDLLIRNKERIEFTIDYNKVSEFLDNVDAIFMCLPTPEIGETGESDLKYYNAAAETLADNLVKRNEGKQKKYLVNPELIS